MTDARSQALENILSKLPDFITEVMEDGSILYMNRSGIHGDVTGRTIFEFLLPEYHEVARQAIQTVLRSGTPVEYRSRGAGSEGSGVHVYQTRLCLLGAGRDVPTVLLSATDITRETCLQEELEIQKLKSIHAAKMATLGEMAGGISHEVNNPLMILQGYGSHLKELALSGVRLEPDKLLVYAEKFLVTTARITTIIRGLKSFARVSTNDPFIAVPIDQIVADTMTLCRSRLDDMAIPVEIVIPENFTVVCRPVGVSQALLNLLGNAADAIRETDKRWIRIQVERNPEKDRLVLSVTDSGPGIRAEVAQRILEPFYTTKPQGEGVGLGLSISVGLIESHGGRLFLDPDSSNTRFVIELPLKQES